MKFILLSGAYINAGDFLIVDRTKKILKELYPNCEIKELKRNENLEKYMTEINASDAIIIGGGPLFMINMYPDIIPLVSNLDDIKTKIIAIGLGWYGKSTSRKYLNNYKFTEKSKKLISRIENDSKLLSCRDWYTVKALQNNGFKNVVLTGCPAWYNMSKINLLDFRDGLNFDYKKICISDPANEVNFEEAYQLTKILKEKYPNSEINFVFHRIDPKSNKYDKLMNKLKLLGVKIVNITGSAQKFDIYDDCDLHIGYRVHAHIYNLSNRNVSFLIEEDGRGTGVNEALGLIGIKAYNSFKVSGNNDNRLSKIIRKIKTKIILNKKYKNTNNFKNDVVNSLDLFKENNYSIYHIAFTSMNYYYEIMKDFIKNAVEETGKK